MRIARNILTIVLVTLLVIFGFWYSYEVIFGCKSIEIDCALVLATILLIVVGSSQLEKLHSYNNLQALFESEREWKSDGFKRQRKSTVKLLKPFLECPKTMDDLDNNKWNEIMTTVEDVLDYFDMVSYYTLSKKLYTIEDIQNCYGYFIKHYWILSCETNYLSNVKRRTGSARIYDNFRQMFDDILKYEKKKFHKKSTEQIYDETKKRLIDFIHEEEKLKYWQKECA